MLNKLKELLGRVAPSQFKVPQGQNLNPATAKIGGQWQPLPKAQPMQRMQSHLSVGGQMPVQSVDGQPLQDTNLYGDGGGTGDMLQPSGYYGGQTSVYGGQNPNLQVRGGAQQPAGSPLTQSVQSPTGSMGADPFGWLRNQIRY
jgi:hypothetical protein